MGHEHYSPNADGPAERLLRRAVRLVVVLLHVGRCDRLPVIMTVAGCEVAVPPASLLDQGESIKVVAGWLGHTEPALTPATYPHPMPTRQAA